MKTIDHPVTFTPKGTLDLIRIQGPTTPNSAADLDYYVERFGDDHNPGLHVAESCAAVQNVLDASLDFLLQGRPRRVADWATLDVPDKCTVLRWALHRVPRSDADYLHRLHGNLEAVEHYDRERSRVLRAGLEEPGTLTLTELAELSDRLMTAAMDLDESMICEHDGYHSALR